MRTHIVQDINLPQGTAALIRKPVQTGDRVVFQTMDQEITVTAERVHNGPGLMKGWFMIEWTTAEKEVNNG